MKRKICFISGSRADYHLLKNLLLHFVNDKNINTQLVVTGMHMEKSFGLTYRDIEKEGISIKKKFKINYVDDTSNGISKSISVAIKKFTQTYLNIKPDIVIILGDRYEIFSAAIAAMVCNLPIAHIHGGEITMGAQDESMRHSITKMSHLHFTSTEQYRKRVIQLGEKPENVFNVGSLGVENIKKIKLLKKRQFEEKINFKLNKKNLLVTYHSVTLEPNRSKSVFSSLLKALSELEETNIIFTKGNSDKGGKVINKLIDVYVKRNINAICFESMGQELYFSAINHMDAVIGNSSSGIIEVPSFNTITLNIGDRQKGRMKPSSVIDVKPDIKSIRLAIKKIYSGNKFMKKNKNPYDSGNASKKIYRIIKSKRLDNILKKAFVDIT